jgi:hypothetical protein
MSRGKGKCAAAWGVACALLLAVADLPARQRHGAQVVVELKDGRSVRGELLTVKRDCLAVGNGSGGSLVELADVCSVRIVRRSKGGYGFLYGLIGGTLIGYKTAREIGDHEVSGEEAFMFGFVLLGLPCAAVGGILGIIAGTDSVRDASEWEPEEYLAELNRHARVRNDDLLLDHAKRQ